MNYKDIDNIVWLIPIKKIRDSLREYLTRLIKDNEFIKLQNNFIIKELSKKGKNNQLNYVYYQAMICLTYFFSILSMSFFIQKIIIVIYDLELINAKQ